MILKTPNGPLIEVFFLTSDLASLLKRVGIPFNNLNIIETYHDKLTIHEIAQIVMFQYQVGNVLGISIPNADLIFKNDYNGGMLKEAFNSLGSNNLSEFINNSEQFSYLNAGANTLIISIDENATKRLSGFSALEACTFSGAVLEAIFKVHGYLESHFGKIVDPGPGEFTMAAVYKLLSMQNP